MSPEPKSFPVETCGKETSISIKDIDIPTISAEFTFSFENAGHMCDGIIHTAKVTPKIEAPISLGELLERDVAEKYYLGKNLEKWEYIKGSKKIERVKQGIDTSSPKVPSHSPTLSIYPHGLC